MIRKPHVSMDFKELPVSEKVTFGQTVHDDISANAATFVDPDVPPATLLTDNNALKAAIVGAQSGDHQKVAVMYAAEKTWDTTFGTEAEYVDRIANGDEPTILLSGYKATKSETLPAVIPETPIVLNVKANPLQGSIHVELNYQQGVRNYIFICSSDGTPVTFQINEFLIGENPKVIAIILDTHRKVDFYKLPSRADVYLTVAAQNTAGISVPSEAILIKTL
jgi:hypothetical protein